MQSNSPSSRVAGPHRSVGLDGSLHLRFFVSGPDSGDMREVQTPEYTVSLRGQVEVDDNTLWSDWSSLELLRYRDSPRLAASEFATAAASLPSGAVASFALDSPVPLDDASAAARRRRRVAVAGRAQWLPARTGPTGKRAGRTGPSLRGYRADERSRGLTGSRLVAPSWRSSAPTPDGRQRPP